MKIIIAGKDRTRDVGTDIVNNAGKLFDRELLRLLDGEKDLLAIGGFKGSDNFLGEFIRLLRFRNSIDYTELNEAFLSRSFLIRFIRKVLWKLINPFNNWFAFKQNAINRSLLYAIEFKRDERLKELTNLKKEIERIKSIIADKR